MGSEPQQIKLKQQMTIFDRIHDVFLLADNRSAEHPGPVKIIVHRLDHLGIVEKAKNARIPILERFQLGVFLFLL